MMNRKEMVETVQALTDKNQMAPTFLDIVKKTGLDEKNTREILNLCIGENKVVAKGCYYLTKKDADEYWKYKSQWGQVKIEKKVETVPVDCGGEAPPVYVEQPEDNKPKRGRPKNEIT